MYCVFVGAISDSGVHDTYIPGNAIAFGPFTSLENAKEFCKRNNYMEETEGHFCEIVFLIEESDTFCLNSEN